MVTTTTTTPRKLLMNLESIAEYYSSGDIAERMVTFAADREVGGRTSTGAYLPRPNILAYPDDIVRMVGEGAVSFHGSVERWSNPMCLSTGLARSELDRMRTGWDFLIDIDSDFLEFSKITCDLIVKALNAHGIKSISVKFSGRAGFHVTVPFEAFPAVINEKPAAGQYPEIPRTLALYLVKFIEPQLKKELKKKPELMRAGEVHDIKQMEKWVDNNGKLTKQVEIEQTQKFEVDRIGNIDSILISSRHFVRLPYSLNEKSWLVSVPIEPSKVLEFNKEQARPSFVVSSKKLMDYCPIESAVPDEASELVNLALSHFSKKDQTEKVTKHVTIASNSYIIKKISEEHFPPCIKGFLGGIGDGRKRAEFVLRTFLRRAGWDWPIIEQYLLEWNRKKNKEPLPDGYITSHVAWQKKQEGRTIMPPNCESAAFYKELGVCRPENFCNGAKNPIVVALRKSRIPAIKEKIPATKEKKGNKTPKTNKKQKTQPPTEP